jgi:hypothetical protein
VPDENTLCQLVVGNYREAVDGEYDYDRRRLGTWIDDVEQHILGMPKRNAESLGKEDAQVTYQWKTGGVTLRFEQLNRWYTSKGVVPRSYYLSEIATRNLPYLDCWRFDFGGRIKQPAPTVPCPECELQCGGCCSICIAPACEKCADR